MSSQRSVVKMSRCLAVFVFIFLCSTRTRAQTADGGAPRTNAQIVISVLSPLEQRVLDLAEAMPADKYAFVPTNGEFTGVRSFAEQLKHLAADLYLDGATILGEQPPGDVEPGEQGSSAVRTKPEIVAYVRTAFAYMRRATAAIDDG